MVSKLVELGIYEKIGEKYKPGMPRLMDSLFEEEVMGYER